MESLKLWLFASFLFTLTASAENWPQWRGPRTDGTSLASGFPIKADTQSLKWKTELPGSGHASPIVWGDRVFAVSAMADTGERVLLCLDRNSGAILWKSPIIQAPLESIHRLNSQ